jgi:hypothetical protein
MNIKELAEQAGFNLGRFDVGSASLLSQRIERFAELVAEQTHTNNKAKWYQEGYEAGQRDEREANIKLLEDFSKTGMVPVKDTWRMGLIAGANAIRGRTE